MKHSDDHSLFAWTPPAWKPVGLLASSPEEFSGSSEVEKLEDSLSSPYSSTNKGIQITLKIVRSACVLARTKAEVTQLSPFAFECRTTGKGSMLDSNGIMSPRKVALLNCQLSDRPG